MLACRILRRKVVIVEVFTTIQERHITNTAIQLVLCAALDCAPPRFAHLPIVVGEDGAKLSSSDGAVGDDALRAAGWLPAAVIDWLARSACPPITALPASTADALAVAFDPATGARIPA